MGVRGSPSDAPPKSLASTDVGRRPLTCPAVVKLERALDAEGLLAGAAPEPVLAVHLGRGQRLRERGGTPRPAPGYAPPARSRRAVRAGVLHGCGLTTAGSTTLLLSPGTRRTCHSSCPVTRPPRQPGQATLPGVSSQLHRSAPTARKGTRRATHLVPAVLVGNVLLQALLAAEQLCTLLTLEQLVA